MTQVAVKDPLAFEVFYDRHGGAAYSLAYRIVGDRQAAEDVTQEALISIWRSGARFDRARGSVRTWTLGIVRNRAIDHLRRDSGRAPKLAFDSEEILERRPAEEMTDTEALRRETARQVRGAITGPSRRAVEGDPTRILRRLQPLRDREDAERAARDNQGQDAAGDGEDPGRAGGRARWRHEKPSRHPDRDDLVGYMLGALEPEQEREVATHVEGCRKCSAERPALRTGGRRTGRIGRAAGAAAGAARAAAGDRQPGGRHRPGPRERPRAPHRTAAVLVRRHAAAAGHGARGGCAGGGCLGGYLVAEGGDRRAGDDGRRRVHAARGGRLAGRSRRRDDPARPRHATCSRTRTPSTRCGSPTAASSVPRPTSFPPRTGPRPRRCRRSGTAPPR